MKKLNNISCFMILILGVIFASTNAIAQDVTKIDPAETGGRIADWVQKQVKNFQTQLEAIGQEQQSTATGDGNKSFKDGKKWLTEKYNSISGKIDEGRTWLDEESSSLMGKLSGIDEEKNNLLKGALSNKKDQQTPVNVEVEKDPTTVMQEGMDALSYKEGQIITLGDRKKKDEQKSSALETSMLGAMNMGAENIASVDEEVNTAERDTSISKTQAGESEVIQTPIENTALQLKAIYMYLMTELKFLEAEVVSRLAAIDSQTKVAEYDIDICKYSEEWALKGMEAQTEFMNKDGLNRAMQDLKSSSEKSIKEQFNQEVKAKMQTQEDSKTNQKTNKLKNFFNSMF